MLINFYTHCICYRVPFWQLVLMFILPRVSRVFDMVSNKFFLNTDESLLLQNNQQLPETDSSLILIRSNWDPGLSHYHWPGIFIQLNADLHVTCKKDKKHSGQGRLPIFLLSGYNRSRLFAIDGMCLRSISFIVLIQIPISLYKLMNLWCVDTFYHGL